MYDVTLPPTWNIEPESSRQNHRPRHVERAALYSLLYLLSSCMPYLHIAINIYRRHHHEIMSHQCTTPTNASR